MRGRAFTIAFNLCQRIRPPVSPQSADFNRLAAEPPQAVDLLDETTEGLLRTGSTRRFYVRATSSSHLTRRQPSRCIF